MSKIIRFILLLPLLFLAACGANESWENEKVKEVSNRILSDDVKVIWKVDMGQTDKKKLPLSLP